MNRAYVLSRTLLILLLIASLLPLQIQTSQAQDAEWDGKSEVDYPRMEAGDSWVFEGYSSRVVRDTYRERIVSRSGIGYFTLRHTAERSGEEGTYTVDLKSHEPQGLLFEVLDFPLYVGKKWRITSEGLSVDKVPLTYVNRYKVLKVETKEVQAGKFKAFKIRMTQTIHSKMGTKYIWYAPDVKRIILTKPSWRKGEELISYRLAGPKTVGKKSPPPTEAKSPPRIRNIVLTSGFDRKNRPRDELKTFSSDQNGEFFVYVEWDDLSPGRSHVINYTLIDEKGIEHDQSTQTVLPTSKSETSWHLKKVPTTAGKWRLVLSMDTKVIGERPFEVMKLAETQDDPSPEIREIFFTREGDDVSEPSDKPYQFNSSKVVYVNVKWANLKPHSSYLVSYTLVDERNHSLPTNGRAMQPQTRTYTSRFPILVPGKPGEWRVEIGLDFETVGEKSFTVTEIE